MRALAAVLVALVLVLSASPAQAFCGFYVAGGDKPLFADASQVVLMRSGTRTVLSMQNDYRGPAEQFALVVPVPVVLQKESVKTLARDVFEKVDRLGSPRLVEYWEQDPCRLDEMEGATGAGLGRGRLEVMPAAAPALGAGVKVEAHFVVGEYEIVILSAQDAAGLETWLRAHKYAIPVGAEPLLRPYVQKGMKFFVAKVDPAKVRVEDGRAALSPLRFHYDAETFSLPVRLGLINSAGDQDLIVNILAQDQRFEVANRPNVTVPTNLELAAGAKDRFAEFYAALFDRTVAEHPGAVVTEYAWTTGSCDPCPGPDVTLSEVDLGTLGKDALPPSARDGARPWVLSRLHARYTKQSLGDDLVFRAAPAILGGRELPGKDGKLATSATPDGTNNFQARYIVRHPWSGAIDCKDPQRGRWGGPPDGSPPSTLPARKTAFAKRGGLNLDAMIGGASTAPVASTTPAATSSSSAISPVSEKKSGCGACALGSSSGGGDAALVLGLGLVSLARARRRSR